MSQASLWLESVAEYEMSTQGVGEGNREAGKVLKLAKHINFSFLINFRLC